MKVKVVTEATISSQHHLPNYVGKCHEKHGHNWRVVVMVEGEPIESGPYEGMVMDFVKIKEAIMRYDHTDLNKFIKNPTAEIMSLTICEDIYIMGDEQGNVSRVVVRIFETVKSYVEADSNDFTFTDEEKENLIKQRAEELEKAREAEKDVRNGGSGFES